MLDETQLAALFIDQESDLVERKRNASDLGALEKAICAFSNDLPGYAKAGIIFVGQEDNLSCSNLQVDDALLLRLATLRDNGAIQPLPSMTVNRLQIEGCTVAVIQVQPSANTPVRVNGRVWIRVGPRRAQATAEEERRLIEKRRWGNLSYDAQSFAGSSLDDLDLVRFGNEFLPSVIPLDILAENHRPQVQQLSALRLIGQNSLPTLTGILFIGKNPLDLVRGAYVQFLRIAGANLTDDIVDQQEISGTIPDQIRQIDELMKLNNRAPASVGGDVRVQIPDYPLDALRQLVRNALMHRTYEGTNAPIRITWYDDRIEIQSPGGPFGQVTVQNFGNEGVTDYRNPTVAGLMKELRLVERFGVGIPIARKLLKLNGNPDLELTVNEQHVLAVVRAIL